MVVASASAAAGWGSVVIASGAGGVIARAKRIDTSSKNEFRTVDR